MRISGAGFNPYSSMARIQKPASPLGTSNVQSANQQPTSSAVDPDRDGDVDSGSGKDIDLNRGRNIDIRA